jgi:hypothetical protein
MNSLRKIGLTALYLAAAEAATSTGTAGTAPASNVGEVAADKPKRAPKNPDNQLNIINGRLPLALVYLIRFKEQGQPTAATAKKYGTSVGKVFDINKGRNFGYIDASYLPSAEDVAAANAWCETGKTAKGQSLKEAGGDPDAIKAAVKGLTVATPEQVAARNWQVKVVGAKKEPAAGAAPVAAAGGTAAGKTEAKLF